MLGATAVARAGCAAGPAHDIRVVDEGAGAGNARRAGLKAQGSRNRNLYFDSMDWQTRTTGGGRTHLYAVHYALERINLRNSIRMHPYGSKEGL